MALKHPESSIVVSHHLDSHTVEHMGLVEVALHHMDHKAVLRMLVGQLVSWKLQSVSRSLVLP